MRPAPIPSKDSFSSVAYGCYHAIVVSGPAGFIQVDAKVSGHIWDAAWELVHPPHKRT